MKVRSVAKIWSDVIFAIFLRDIKSKFSDKLGLSWSVLSPLLFIMVLTLARGSLDGGVTHNMPTYFFMAYGILLVRFFVESTGSISNAISSNKALFSFRQVQPISAFLASLLFEVISKMMVLIFIIVIGYYLKFDISLNNIIGMMLSFLSIGLLSFSLGVTFSISRCFVPEVAKIRTFILRPLIFVSGAFFSLKDISPEYWKYFTWNPIIHAVEYIRSYSISNYSPEGVSLTYLAMSTFISLFLSLCLYQATWKKAISL